MTTLADTDIDLMPAIDKLNKDLRKAVVTLSDREARYLVDLYYQMQDNRKRGDNQTRAMTESGEPHGVISWVAVQSETLETRVKQLLDSYSRSKPIGKWARGICGIGPVIAAGLMAHIDITKAPTVGHIWRFAGLDPTQKWEKGQKRPWNASLKVLCWKIGESFVKVSGNDRDVYGKVWLRRKEEEQAKNEAGAFADQAKAVLEARRIGKETEAYKHYSGGKLPPAHIHARAKRYAVKLFLSHWHERAYEFHFGTKPPLPYPIAILNHAHKVEPPDVE